ARVVSYKPSPFPADQAGEGIGRAIEWCSRMGYCGSVTDNEPRHVSDYFPKTGEVSADDFAYWVYVAEGRKEITPELAPTLPDGQQFRAAFIHFMGSNRVAASALTWP
ncbi:MAG: hypothetical protein ACRED3_16500, partial [Bradyrhizobium sp.]